MFALNICCCLGQCTSGLLQFSFMCWLFNDSMQNCSHGCGFQCAKLLLVGAATSIIFVATNTCRDKCLFVATKHVFCRDKSMLVATKLLLRRTRVCGDKDFVATNIILSRQKFCRGKHTFVVASILLSRQKTCFVASDTCLSPQTRV